MPLTARQKHYVKKHRYALSAEELALNSGAPAKEILRFLKKDPAYREIREAKKPAAGTGIPTGTDSGFKPFVIENQWFLIGLALLVLLAYSNSLGNAFVSDDLINIANNPEIGKLGNVFAYFPNGLIQKIIYFFIYKNAGPTPWLFRSVNILAHLASTWLLFAIVSRLAKKPIALMAAALFAVHPLLTEAVTWVSGSPYSLSAPFFLASFLLYLTGRDDRKRYRNSIILFALALISNEKIMPLFLAFPLYEYCYGDLRKHWKKAIPYFLLSSVWLAFFATRAGGRVSSITADAPEQDASAFYDPLIQIPVAVATYLGLAAWPDKLSLYQTEMSFSQARYAWHVIVFLAFLALLAWTFRKSRRTFFWLAFFVLSLLVTLTPLKIAWVVAERYAYIGSIGLFVPVAFLFSRWADRNETGKKLAYPLFALLIAALMIRTIERNADWKSEDSLWLATAKVAPSGQNIHNNLGDMYARQGNPEKAIEEFKKAIEINPRYADAYHNLANTYQQLGDYASAVPNYEKALELNPNLWQSDQALAAIAFDQGNYPEALGYIEKALAIDPDNDNLKQNLATIQSKLGN